MDRLAAPNARRINLPGRTVIPGLIDNHNHLLRAGTTWPLELRFDGVGTRKKAIEMIRAWAKQVGPGQWVFNIGGWATAQFSDDPKPFTREELDQIAPDNPVALQVVLPGLSEQPWSEGIRNRAERARPSRLRQRVDHARRGRRAHGRDQETSRLRVPSPRDFQRCLPIASRPALCRSSRI